jgi:phosphatidylglycerol:prolipoprotein diacylglycerol transferase
LSADLFFDLCAVIMLAAFVGARLFHVFAYAPGEYLADPLKILRIWEGGLSSIGGFIGAGIGAALFIRAKKMPWRAYTDVCALVLPLGYGCGRVGCFLIHDHPGTLSNSPLAVQYPGGARLDHGLLLAILGLSLFAAFWALNRRWKLPANGAKGFLPLFMVSYGSIRFVLDFFRATDLTISDVRYLGLTPAQYACLAMIAGGVWIFASGRRAAAAPASGAPAA